LRRIALSPRDAGQETILAEPDAARPRFKTSPPVFFGSAAVIFAVVAVGAAAPDVMDDLFSTLQGWIVDTFGWFYMLSVAVFLVFALGLAASGLGRIKLGPDDAEPDYGYGAWFAMLFSAGMGIGLMFFGVAEPVMHYTSPPAGEGGTVAAAREAMAITFFHWGVHAWAIYAVIALALAFFSYRLGLPLTIRSALYPLLGERIHGAAGHVVDILAVVGTMFGVATSLGLGVMQVNSGLSHLFGIPNGVAVQLGLIGVITALATGSVVSGLDNGIRRLSQLNLILALALVAFVLLAGPTLFLFKALIQNIGAYLGSVVERTFNLYAYRPNDWIGGWTLFYWAWWIAWSPFVGMFIARISRGRTIREFVVGVLLVPVGFTFLWLTVFGNSAMALDMGAASGAIAAAVGENVSTALFRFLEFFPFGGAASLVATVLVVTFFVTSSDSGSLVIDIITAGGDPDPPVVQRIFWAVTEGAVASVLLLAGGLKALQTASITAALPFAFVMLLVCFGLWKGLRLENMRRLSLALPPEAPVRGAQPSWQQRLRRLVDHPDRDRAARFLAETVRPALDEVAGEFRRNGLEAALQVSDVEAAITVFHGDEREFLYAVRLAPRAAPDFAWRPVAGGRDGGGPASEYWRAEVHLLEGGQSYDLVGRAKEQVIADVLAQYERHLHFLQLIR
jgi:choline/glycine/proline betaine transport protein